MMINKELENSILDPIHGLIKMTKEEFKVISHPLFNRLRFIKQNTFLYNVFPSANHTRFEHSIGVMHLASEMFNNAFYNASVLHNKRDKYKLEKSNTIFEMTSENSHELMDSYYLLRLAALLHDIGHGPMSHLFDKFAPEKVEFLNVIRNDQAIEFSDILVEKLDELITGQKVEHEHVSLYFSAIILSEIGIQVENIKKVLTIMNGKIELADIKCNNMNITIFLHQIVAGAPLDCDRMDYLLRDSYFTGVKYGIYDLNRVLKSLLPFIHDNKLKLGIKKSGLPAIENFLQARFGLFQQVYFHKTNQACNLMLEKSTEELLDSAESFVKCSSVEEFKTSYLNLSDEKFLDLLESKLEKDNLITIKELRQRKLWKRLIEVYPEDGANREEDIDAKLTEIEKLLNEKDQLRQGFYTKKVIVNRPLKDMNGTEAVLISKDVDNNYNLVKDSNWINDSKIFKALSYKDIIGRIYLRVDSSGENEKESFRTLKREIFEKINLT